VALIRTDVSEDRFAAIFRVNEYEQVQSEGDTILRNVGSYKSYTASSPRR
jgi:hypothetical protein